MPKVSVIIPTYNSIRYLPDAVGSALSQTFTDLEVIVINDGSSDATEEWLLQQSDSRLIFISQPNLGKSVARNVGISKAQGEYLAFLDADDYWEPTKLEKQINCLDNNPNVGLVYTWTALADEDGQPTGRVIDSEAEGNVWQQLLQFNIVACGSTPMVRSHCFKTVGLFSEELPLAQDWDMWIRIAAHYPFAVIKEPLVRYRLHANNTSKKLQAMQKYSHLVLERAFQSTSTDRSDIKAKAYQSLNLYLGWVAISIEDPKQAFHWWNKALRANPKDSFSSQSIRLLAAIVMVQFFGGKTYQKLTKFNRVLRK